MFRKYSTECLFQLLINGISRCLRINKNVVGATSYDPRIMIRVLSTMNRYELNIVYRHFRKEIQYMKEHYFKGKIPIDRWFVILKSHGLRSWYIRLVSNYEGGTGLYGARCKGTARVDNLIINNTSITEKDKKIINSIVKVYF